MSQLQPVGPEQRRCPACGAELNADARFCGSCGAEIEKVVRMPATAEVQPSPLPAAGRRPSRSLLVAAAAAVVLIALAVFGLASERSSRQHAFRQLHAQVDHQTQQLQALQAQNATLARRVGKLQGALNKQGAGFAPLAQRILRSVYTVESGQELGTAWVAWRSGGVSYLITASHVVADALASGDRSVKLKQKGVSVAATVVKTDTTNDLALVRTTGKVGAALWQAPQLGVSPLVGDQLLLVGSPYGLEGTVTQGVVSRVTYDEIQTDAAANPGNSGGPAVDRDGQVVGVLLAGGGENLNFAAPIQRACVSLRSCR